MEATGQMSMTEPTTLEFATESQGRGFLSSLLLDPLACRKDIGLVSQAVRRWKLSDDKKAIVVERLIGIIEKTSIGVMTKDGIESVDGPADANAIAAARVVVTIEGQLQTDDLGVAGTTVNVGVNYQQYEERVAGLPYAEVRARLLAEAKAMVRRFETDDEASPP